MIPDSAFRYVFFVFVFNPFLHEWNRPILCLLVNFFHQCVKHADVPDWIASRATTEVSGQSIETFLLVRMNPVGDRIGSDTERLCHFSTCFSFYNIDNCSDTSLFHVVSATCFLRCNKFSTAELV